MDICLQLLVFLLRSSFIFVYFAYEITLCIIFYGIVSNLINFCMSQRTSGNHRWTLSKEIMQVKFTSFFFFQSCSFLQLSQLSQDYDSDEKFPISDDKISHLLPTSYQDMIVRVYSKKAELVCGRNVEYICYNLLLFAI